VSGRCSLRYCEVHADESRIAYNVYKQAHRKALLLYEYNAIELAIKLRESYACTYITHPSTGHVEFINILKDIIKYPQSARQNRYIELTRSYRLKWGHSK